METLLVSAKTYVEVLKSCDSRRVASWKTEDLKRAVNWAAYFERVQSRIGKNASAVRKLDEQLRLIGRQTGRRFGGEELTSSFLGRSKPYLLKALLENTFLPSELKDTILQRYSSSSELEKVPLRSSIECLLEDIQWLLPGEPDQPSVSVLSLIHSTRSSLPHCVCSRLDEFSQFENGWELLLLSTLPPSAPHAQKTSQPEATPTTPSPGSAVVLQWLLQEANKYQSSQPFNTATTIATVGSSKSNTVLKDLNPPDSIPPLPTHPLWLQSSHLLARVACNHLCFYRSYIKMLITVVDGLQQQVIEQWENNAVTTETETESSDVDVRGYLEDHFKALVLVGRDVKMVTVSLLKSQTKETLAILVALTLSSANKVSDTTNTGNETDTATNAANTASDMTNTATATGNTTTDTTNTTTDAATDTTNTTTDDVTQRGFPTNIWRCLLNEINA